MSLMKVVIESTAPSSKQQAFPPHLIPLPPCTSTLHVLVRGVDSTPYKPWHSTSSSHSHSFSPRTHGFRSTTIPAVINNNMAHRETEDYFRFTGVSAQQSTDMFRFRRNMSVDCMRAQELQCVIEACMREYMRVRLGARRMEQASS
jgi:hypothetical protein